MKIKKTFFVWILVILTGKGSVFSQDFKGRYGVGLIGSPIKMVGGQVDRSTIDQWAGLQLRYGLSSIVSLQASLAYGWVYPRDLNGSHFKAIGDYKTELFPLDLNFSYNFISQSNISPVMSLGIGLVAWDIRKLEGTIDTFSRGKSLNGSRLDATVTGGLGMEFFLSQDYAFNLLLNYKRILKGNEDTIGFGDDGNDGILELRLSLSYLFGGFKDQDKDGIEDKFDLDPLHPEDFDGCLDQDGIPDPDNDKDGIPDSKDKAPDHPEDFDGYQDKDGVPDPDNDGDKIPDIKDKCPHQSEDFDEFEDHDGCPDFDNDKDGIADSLDQCPNWAEDYNGYLDADGCPDEKPAPEPEPVEQGKSIVLKGVNFESGGAWLKPESYLVLDEVVKTLTDHPAIEIEIRGYTDDVGNFAANQRLSEQRAYAVRKYLVDHGIDPRRINAIGFGERYPIASNLTPDGRAANRRIEFVRIK